MRDQQFWNWMKTVGKEDHTPMVLAPMRDAMSRCQRVENGFGVDLDEEFNRDKGKSVIDRLNYSREDEQMNVAAPKGLYFKPGANLYNGLASLKNAAKKYFRFCAERSNP